MVGIASCQIFRRKIACEAIVGFPCYYVAVVRPPSLDMHTDFRRRAGTSKGHLRFSLALFWPGLGALEQSKLGLWSNLGHHWVKQYIKRQLWACTVILLKNPETFGLLFLGQMAYIYNFY